MRPDLHDADAPVCHSCGFLTRCLPRSLRGDAVSHFSGSVSKVCLSGGARIALQGTRADFAYCLRHGSLKVTLDPRLGRWGVIDFVLPHEVIGVGDLFSGRWSVSVHALEDSELCAVPRDAITDSMMADVVWCQEQGIRRVRESSAALSHACNRTRIAAFFCRIGRSQIRQGRSNRIVRLRMSHADLADYLGMRSESLSRNLAEMVRSGLLRRMTKAFEIPDPDALEAVARGE